MKNEFILTILLCPNLNHKLKRRLITSNYGIEDFNSIVELIMTASRESKKFPTKQDIVSTSIKANDILLKSRELGIFPVSIFDKEYSYQLKQVKSPPLLLFAIGNLSLLNRPSVTVVGTRYPSTLGSNVSYRIGKFLAENNIAVISGLALGCDSQAHIGCLDFKGKTIAILGHGLDTIYPEANFDLYNRILMEDGLLISEYPIGTPVQKNHFIARNRIQAWLSLATIITQSGSTGGTLSTGNFAMKENRHLGCFIPNSHQSTKGFEGNINLVNENMATPISSLSDLKGFVDLCLLGDNKQLTF